MNRQYIDDHHVVARYLADRLPAAERDAFEEYFLTHPEMIQELEETAQLKAGLMHLRDTGQLESLLQPGPWYRHPRIFGLSGRIGGTLAAAVVLSIGVALWFARAPSPSERWLAPSPASLLGPLGKPLQAGATYTILRTRGETADLEIELPHAAQALTLRILPEGMAQPAVYRVTLYSAQAAGVTAVATVEGLTPEEDEFVPVYLDSSKVAAGRYRLVIEGGKGTGDSPPRSAFALRFVE